MKPSLLLVTPLLVLPLASCQTADSSTQAPIAHEEPQPRPGVWSEDAVYGLSELPVPPLLIKSVLPKYPEQAREQWITGTVIVEFVVDEEGNVRNPFIYKTSNPVFNEAALDAVKQWRFEPGELNGKPVKVRVRQPLPFLLSAPPSTPQL